MTIHSTSTLSTISVQIDGLRELIARRYGFWVKDAWLNQLQDRVASRMQAADARSFSDYLERLKNVETGRGELHTLIEDLFIHETSFFRTQPHFDALKDCVLPSLFGGKTETKVRIACLGCSSGEEPYSVAIAACQALPKSFLSSLEITGLDASTRVLNKAKSARYSSLQLRELDPSERTRWFSRAGELWEVRPEIRQMVRFYQHNLMEPLTMTGLDVIFCRNVLIYFSRSVVASVISSCHSALSLGGYLFLGHTESALEYSKLFRPIHAADTVYYQRLAIAP